MLELILAFYATGVVIAMWRLWLPSYQIVRELSPDNIIIQKPNLKKNLTKSFGELRELFDKALLSGNEQKADALIRDMKKTGRLDSQNLSYLSIHKNAILGNWDDILVDNHKYIMIFLYNHSFATRVALHFLHLILWLG